MNLLDGANPNPSEHRRHDRLKDRPESTTKANSFLGITRGNSDDVPIVIGLKLHNSPSAEDILRLEAGSRWKPSD